MIIIKFVHIFCKISCHLCHWLPKCTYNAAHASSTLHQTSKSSSNCTVGSEEGIWLLDCVWNVTAHAQEPDFVFRRHGRDHLNQRRRHFSRLLAAEVCASAVVMLDTPCSDVAWRVLATHSIRQVPLHFPSRASHRVPSHFNWTLPPRKRSVFTFTAYRKSQSVAMLQWHSVRMFTVLSQISSSWPQRLYDEQCERP